MAIYVYIMSMYMHGYEFLTSRVHSNMLIIDRNGTVTAGPDTNIYF